MDVRAHFQLREVATPQTLDFKELVFKTQLECTRYVNVWLKLGVVLYKVHHTEEFTLGVYIPLIVVLIEQYLILNPHTP